MGRVVSGVTSALTYNAENRLTQVVSGTLTASYGYNGDGQRVTLTTGCTTTTYVGAYFEWAGSAATMKSYYYAGGTRVALRTGMPITGTVHYLVGDHLGSSSVSYRVGDGQTATQRYYPWGTIRPGPDNVLPTDYTFTGQKLDASAGLMYYGARYYDAALGRFIQADTIVPQPGNPQAMNRYAYALNNPTKYRDPSGHWVDSALDIAFIGYDIYDIKTNGLTWISGLSLAADVAGLLLPVVTGGGLLVRAATHADDVAKVVSHADDVVKAASHADDAAKAVETVAKEAPIVMGENMKRVQAYADKIGGKTINDFIPAERWSMEANETWVKQMRTESREMVDIGPDFGRRADRVKDNLRPDSPAYNLERKELQGYEGYRKVFERTGKYRGGIPGIDWE